jgi:acyl carrier protein
MPKLHIKSVTDLVTRIAEQPLGNVTYDDDLLACGYLDSFAFVQLILLLQDEFKLAITEEMQLDQRLRSINGIFELIEKG